MKKREQELRELEIQYEKLSKEQEELKKRMLTAQKPHDISTSTVAEEEGKKKTGNKPNPTDLNTSIFQRELKIQAQIGEPGQKDKLTYQSLISQIETGLSKGYTEKEVINAVIRSVQAGLQLRSYLEELAGLTLTRLRKILRFHFQEKNATELCQLLANISQTPKENAQDFLIRALTIRQKILLASKESESKIKYDEELVQGLFFYALETGLADETIQAKIRPLLKNASAADEELIEVMSQAMSAETERTNKFNLLGRTKLATKVSIVEAGTGAESHETVKSKTHESQILAAIKAIQSELNAVQSEMATLHKKVDGKSGTNTEVGKGARLSRSTYPRKCKSCQENNN